MTDDRLVWGALSTRKTVCTHMCVCVCVQGGVRRGSAIQGH